MDDALFLGVGLLPLVVFGKEPVAGLVSGGGNSGLPLAPLDDTVKKQKCPDFSIGATQKDSHGEPKISIFPPNLRVRRTCTSAYKWVDALEVDAGMPQNQFEYNMDIRKKQVLRQLFSFLFVPGAAPVW